MTISNLTETAIMNLVFRAVAWANYADNAATSPETNIVCSLNTADPGDAGFANTSEAAYTSYARTNVARTTGGWSLLGSAVSPDQPGLVSPAANIDFPAGTGGGETVTFSPPANRAAARARSFGRDRCRHLSRPATASRHASPPRRRSRWISHADC